MMMMHDKNYSNKNYPESLAFLRKKFSTFMLLAFWVAIIKKDKQWGTFF